MARRIVVTAGPDNGREAVVEEGEILVVGRGDDTNFQLQDTSVSRRHCQLQLNGSRLFIWDMQSKGGTRVNGNLVPSAELSIGDTIAVGDSQLRVHPVRLVVRRTTVGLRKFLWLLILLLLALVAGIAAAGYFWFVAR